MYEGLFEGIRDADEVSSLVDAVGSGLRPRPRGQQVELVAVVVERVGRPGAASLVPPCDEYATQIKANPPSAWGSCVTDGQEHLVQMLGAGEGALVPWLWRDETDTKP